jgi:NAD(P) transhydrogenase subunit alpha
VKIGVLREQYPGETRVALTPQVIPSLKKAGCEVWVERGAGALSFFPDDQYASQGAQIKESREEILKEVDILVVVRSLGADPEGWEKNLPLMKEGIWVVGFLDPFQFLEGIVKGAERKINLVALELLPRITRAQNMDALSSMGTIAGYRSALLLADHLPRFFPMLTTAAGTIYPAKVFVIGAGVAGLMAIATAKKLGAVVSAYDVRKATKEQVQSVGGKFVELGIEPPDAEDKSGYAKALAEEFYQKQRELLTAHLKDVDGVITTAQVPGKPAPKLITEEMVRGMKPGSVIVDLAAERGGNCTLTKPGEIVEYEGVKILGPVNLPATLPHSASQMYSRNLTNFLTYLMKNGEIALREDDEIVKGVLLTYQGKIVHPLFIPAS